MAEFCRDLLIRDQDRIGLMLRWCCLIFALLGAFVGAAVTEIAVLRAASTYHVAPISTRASNGEIAR